MKEERISQQLMSSGKKEREREGMEKKRKRNWKRIFNGTDEGPILVKRKPQRNAAMCTRVNRIRLIYRSVLAFPPRCHGGEQEWRSKNAII